jgi:phage terminase small subunit
VRELTPKQQKFVEEYLLDLNATQACQRAGYKVSTQNADKLGSQLIGNARVKAAIQKKMDARSKRTEITSDRVLQELAKIGFGNIKNLYDSAGNLLHVQDMPPEVTATIQEVTEEVLHGATAKVKGEVKGEEGDPEEVVGVVLRRKYKVADKKASLELLGKHLKLFTDKIELGGGLTLKRIRKTYDGTVDDGD